MNYLQLLVKDVSTKEDAEDFYRRYVDKSGLVVEGQVTVELQNHLYRIFPDAFVSAQVRKHAS